MVITGANGFAHGRHVGVGRVTKGRVAKCPAEFRWPTIPPDTETTAWAGPEDHKLPCRLEEGHPGLHYGCWVDIEGGHYETEWAG